MRNPKHPANASFLFLSKYWVGHLHKLPEEYIEKVRGNSQLEAFFFVAFEDFVKQENADRHLKPLQGIKL